MQSDFNAVQFGANVRKWRLKRGMTRLRDLAEPSGISVSHLCDVECGRALLALPSLKRVTAELKVTTEKILEGC